MPNEWLLQLSKLMKNVPNAVSLWLSVLDDLVNSYRARLFQNVTLRKIMSKKPVLPVPKTVVQLLPEKPARGEYSMDAATTRHVTLQPGSWKILRAQIRLQKQKQMENILSKNR